MSRNVNRAEKPRVRSPVTDRACGTTALEELGLSTKLWFYTNFDCNLGCTYCVTKSTPTTPRRPLGVADVRKLVDEGTELGFRHFFFTGGEPFLLDEIYLMLAYASARMTTTVLTNGVLLHTERLDRLVDVANENLRVQVSLDGARPEHHDAYRGHGTWARTVNGIEALLTRGIRVCISTTETPANSSHMDTLHTFRRGLGIADRDHLVRPLARHGFSEEGLELRREDLEPELTLTAEGVFWHPLTFPGDAEMAVRSELFPLAAAIEAIAAELLASVGPPRRKEFV